MSFTYTVNKRSANRISYRILGSVFFLIAVLQFVTMLKGIIKHPMLTMMFMVLLGAYGLYLIYSSFRQSAYDITYRFDDEGLTVTHRYGVTHYDFEQIEFVTMVLADEAGLFPILNVKAGRRAYVIPFTMKGELCARIYNFVNERIPHKDDEESEIEIPEKYRDTESHELTSETTDKSAADQPDGV